MREKELFGILRTDSKIFTAKTTSCLEINFKINEYLFETK